MKLGGSNSILRRSEFNQSNKQHELSGAVFDRELICIPDDSKSFCYVVYPGMEEEYERRHSPIWPELEEVLKNHGVINYSIFLHTESNQLFAYAEIEDEACWNSIAEPPICQKWWAHMKDLLA